MSRRLLCFGLGGAAALALLAATPAAAHVTVQPGEAPKGGYAKLAFRVPNESQTAGTVKLEVTFPQEAPLSAVRTKPMTGWTARVGTATLATPVKVGDAEITEAVRTVTWTAQPGVRIGPGEFTEFEVSVGPLPTGRDRLVLPAAQTYDDGRVVNWDAPPAAGGEEPEHPAPVLALVAAGGQHGAAAAGGGTSPSDGAAGAADERAAADGTATPGATARDDTARWLGGAGLAVGALGVGLAAGAVLAGRRRDRAAAGGHPSGGQASGGYPSGGYPSGAEPGL